MMFLDSLFRIMDTQTLFLDSSIFFWSGMNWKLEMYENRELTWSEMNDQATFSFPLFRGEVWRPVLAGLGPSEMLYQ